MRELVCLRNALEDEDNPVASEWSIQPSTRLLALSLPLSWVEIPARFKLSDSYEFPQNHAKVSSFPFLLIVSSLSRSDDKKVAHVQEDIASGAP
jgi:hypothetical protein